MDQLKPIYVSNDMKRRKYLDFFLFYVMYEMIIMAKFFNNISRQDNSVLNPQFAEDILKSRAIKSAGITITERLTEYAINTLSVIILARLLTPADFGLVAMVASLTGIFGIFRDLGLSDVTIQAVKLDQMQASSLFWVNSLFNASITVLLIICSPLIAKFYKEPKLTGITILYSFSFLFIGLSTQHYALLKRAMRFGQIAIVGISSTILSITISIIMASLGFGYWSIITRQVSLAFFSTIGAWIFLSWRPARPAFSKEIWRMIKMGLNIVGFIVLNYFAHNLDKMLIGWRLGADTLGYYDRAFQLSVMPVSLLAMPLHSVAVSTLSKLRQQPEIFSNYYLNSLKVLTFFGLPTSAFLCLMSKDVVFILLGSKWAETAIIFRILSISIWGSIIYGTHGWVHIALGRTDRWFRWGFIQTPILIMAYFITIKWGARAVAMSYAISLTLLTFPSILYAARPIRLSLKNLAAILRKYFIATIGSGIFLYFIISSLSQTNIFLRLSISFIIYGVSYLLLIIIISRSLSPIKEVANLIHNFLTKRILFF